MNTIQKIFELEGHLSPSHILQIRSVLMPDTTAEDYLATLEDEARLSQFAMNKAGEAAKQSPRSV